MLTIVVAGEIVEKATLLPEEMVGRSGETGTMGTGPLTGRIGGNGTQPGRHRLLRLLRLLPGRLGAPGGLLVVGMDRTGVDGRPGLGVLENEVCPTRTLVEMEKNALKVSTVWGDGWIERGRRRSRGSTMVARANSDKVDDKSEFGNGELGRLCQRGSVTWRTLPLGCTDSRTSTGRLCVGYLTLGSRGHCRQ